jgi:hypothetical protein
MGRCPLVAGPLAYSGFLFRCHSRAKPARRQPRAAAAGDKGKGRKLTLTNAVFDRLVLTAIKRGSTASAVAAEILDRNLPRLRIAADD